ncbi:MAG: ABC transporter ATP-binding protein [Methanosarcinaceae archaeon]|nr:ABC transporter ATP-binding protein [Methanosarcinaceae archaeon]
MNCNNIAYEVENLSKIYRIGAKERIHDSFARTVLEFIKSPYTNYKKYRSLYTFDDQNLDAGGNSSDTIWALRDVSFKVGRGEVLGIIGRNGSGKSTLLKILSKITYPTRGYAKIYGRVSSLLEVGTGFHPELTGKENIYLNGTILGMRKNEIDAKYDEIVEFSGVEKFLNTPVKRYSSGMKVRLAFSVAAHLEPEILIVDEVLAVGDADFQKKSLNKMENVTQEGRTVLFVSHSMPAITRICTRAIHLENGSVVDDGPAEQVVANYMRSGTGTAASKVWDNPTTAPQGPAARLMAVRVTNGNGSIADSIDIRKPVILEMEYEMRESGHVAMPHFGLRNEYGDSIFVTVDQDPDWRGKPRPEGEYSSKVEIPGNLLAENTIYVNCFLMTLNPNVIQFAALSIISFVVVDSLDGDSARGDYTGIKFPGVVRPLLNWSTEFTPSK